MYTLPDFKSHEERRQYIAINAEYYTTFCRINMQRIKSEFKMFGEAISYSKKIALENNKSIVIYGVLGPYDTYITTIHPGDK